MSTAWIDLPWQSLVVLASGYAGYFLAFAGIRQHHKAIDVAFASLVFGMVTLGGLTLGTYIALPNPLTAIIAVISTWLSALIWRKWGRSLLRSALYKFDFSWSDDDPSAWFSIATQQDFNISQCAVYLDDGTWLMCDDAAKFENAPIAPCIFGPDGDVALYVTHKELPNGSMFEMESVFDDEYGPRLTYVPKKRISQVCFRFVERD
jgi:hypothetical protein